jgi:glycosyltransferase involved in cell wall biosynthesis
VSRKYNIAIISKSDSSGGGASRVAEKLYGMLAKTIYIGDHWIVFSDKLSKQNFKFITGNKLTTFIWRLFGDLSRKIGLSDIVTPEGLGLFIRGFKKKYDLIHLHDTSQALSPFTIRYLSLNKPTIWTLHDCSAFTAGCLYPMECNHFTNVCHSCNKLHEWPLSTSIDNTRYIHKLKKFLFSNSNIQLVTPSYWMAEQVKASKVFPTEAIVIPNGVDTNKFKASTANSYDMKNKHNIDQDVFIIIISASSLSDPRKGFIYSIEALKKWNKKFHLVLVGYISDDIKNAIEMFNYTVTGYIDSDDLLVTWYSIADIFLFTSLADNFPNVILEHMSCKTPVIAFNTGGVGEMIDHDINGWLCRQKDIDGLIEGIDKVYNNKKILNSWSVTAREKVISSFSNELFIERHITLYHSMIKTHEE